MVARNVLWSLKKNFECAGIVDYDIKAKKFIITDMNKWIDLTWVSSHIGMQRFAFQQLYNSKFNKETLENLDAKFGLVDQDTITLFQQEVKKLCDWKKLSGKVGYKTFLKYFDIDITDDQLGKLLQIALDQSTTAGYHKFVEQKEWKSYINKKK